jgi:hypothetical protein
VLVPPVLPPEWLPDGGPERVPDQAADTAAELDAVDSVVTGCAPAVAETGTIVLDGSPDQGRRRITLVPDHHVCVVRTPDQVVSSVPQALERLDPTRPLTWISGPPRPATSNSTESKASTAPAPWKSCWSAQRLSSRGSASARRTQSSWFRYRRNMDA